MERLGTAELIAYVRADLDAWKALMTAWRRNSGTLSTPAYTKGFLQLCRDEAEGRGRYLEYALPGQIDVAFSERIPCA